MPGRYRLHETFAHVHRSWLQLVLFWVAQRWSDAMTWLSSHIHIGRNGTRTTGDVIVVVCLIAIGAVGAHLLMSVQRSRDRALGPVTSGSARRNARALVAAAMRAADEGRYSLAVRTIFAAALTLLDVRGVVSERESATINELRRAVGERSSQAQAPFVDIARLYTTVAYAEETVDERSWVRARDAYALLEREVSA